MIIEMSFFTPYQITLLILSIKIVVTMAFPTKPMHKYNPKHVKRSVYAKVGSPWPIVTMIAMVKAIRWKWQNLMGSLFGCWQGNKKVHIFLQILFWLATTCIKVVFV